MSQLGELLDQLVLMGFTDERGYTLENATAYTQLRQIAQDMDKVLTPAAATDLYEGARQVEAARDRAKAKLTADARPWAQATVVLSTVQVQGVPYPVTVAWDTCAKCNLHIKLCRCANGPTEPPSVSSWRPENAKQDITKLPASADSTLIVVEDPLDDDSEDDEYILPLGDDTEEVLDAPRVPNPSRLVSGPVAAVQDVQLPAEDVKAEVPEGTCKSCGKAVTLEDADQNDDGTWTCFVCQQQEG